MSAIRSYRNGHTGIYSLSGSCTSLGGSDVSTTLYGVCAKPHEDAFVVTHQPGNINPLGLSAGERVVTINGISGPSLVDHILAGPVCGSGTANDDVRHEHAAEALFGSLRAGDTLTIEGLDGETRIVTAGPPSAGFGAVCRFPAGASGQALVEAILRPDGVAVIRLRRFYLLPGEPGHFDAKTAEEYQQLLDHLIGTVKTAFDTVAPTATGIIWDIRANAGGASLVGFAIAAGMPGFTEVPIARCSTRVAASVPPAYFHYGPDYDLVENTTFTFTGPTALLIDGMAISAADYFARAVMLGTDTRIFGRPTAGAYGGGGAGFTLDPERGLYMGYDPYKCDDIDGVPLETTSVPPDQWVEYAPMDLANGVDTVLEAAATWVLSE